MVLDLFFPVGNDGDRDNWVVRASGVPHIYVRKGLTNQRAIGEVFWDLALGRNNQSKHCECFSLFKKLSVMSTCRHCRTLANPYAHAYQHPFGRMNRTWIVLTIASANSAPRPRSGAVYWGVLVATIHMISHAKTSMDLWAYRCKSKPWIQSSGVAKIGRAYQSLSWAKQGTLVLYTIARLESIPLVS